MFARVSRSKKKSGTYEYLVISESIHIKGKGSSTRDIANLGNIKKLNSNDIDNIIDGLIRVFKSEKYALSDQVKILESLEHGSIIFWQQLWSRLQLPEIIKKIEFRNERIEIDLAKYVEMMVIHRCADPLSKLPTSKWINRTCYKAMKGYHNLNMSDDYFYRSMNYLLSIKDELELALYTKLKSFFSSNVILTEVEMLFDDLKHIVNIDSVRHWNDYRARAHVCICILSLLLKRIFEIDCLNGKEMIEVLEEIEKSKLIRYEVKYSEKEDRRQVLPKITQCTDLQKQIFKLVGVNNPMSLERFVC